MDLLKQFKAAMGQPTFSDFQQFEQSTLSENKTSSIESTLAIALRCSNLGQAFAVGYRCALQSLLPSLKQDQWAAMCVTEITGNHPKQIQTHVDEAGVVSGQKSFVTMATSARQLIVIAKAGETEQYPILKAVLVEQSEHSNIQVQPMPSLGMIPDIQHGQLSLDGVNGKLLPGDGYVDYSKRFRTLEDIHVLTAFTSLVMSMSYRYGLPSTILQKGLFILNFVLTNQLSENSIQHLNIHQAFELFRSLTEEFIGQAEKLPDDFVEEWKRDSKLFKVASKARNARKKRALEELIGEA